MNSVYLRALQSSDLEYTYKWHTDENLYRTLSGSFRYVSIDAEKDWLQRKIGYSNEEINLMICLKELPYPIGFLSVREINWQTRIGQFTGLLIADPEHQGKHYGTEALNLLLKHCFNDLGLNRLYGYILEDNVPSRKMCENCGFKIEGTLKQHAFKNGKFQNLVVIGLCAEDYYQNK